MLSINYPRTYAQTGEIAAYRPVRRPDRTLPIQLTNGQFTLGGVRFPLYIASMVESSSLPKVDAEMVETIKRVVSDGFNGIFLRAPNGRMWTETGWNWGVWQYASSDSNAANRWAVEPDALTQLDKMVQWSLDLGLEVVYFDLTGYDENIIRHPNMRPYGTYFAEGMQWSSEARQMMWDGNVRIISRYIDNPRVMWKLFNENGFSDAFRKSGNVSWGGGTSMSRFDKIVDNIDDVTPAYTGAPVNNGYWYTELNEKLFAWRDAHAPGWTIPAWGRGSSGIADGQVGFPKRSTWLNWATGADPAADKNYLIDFLTAMDVEAVADTIARMRALNPTCVLNTGTMGYIAPQAHFTHQGAAGENLFTETHHYFYDNTGIGVKTGTAYSRRSISDPTWNFVTDGAGWFQAGAGVRSSKVGFIASECGQYTPNRWRYQRMYYETFLACMHGTDIADFMQSQQYLMGQARTDGRYMTSDNANCASPAVRLSNRAMTAVHRHQMLSEHTDSFTIQATSDSIKAWQHANTVVGMQCGANLNSNATDGCEHAVWGTKKIFVEIDTTNTATPTTDQTAIKVLDATLAAGFKPRDTATEKLYIKRPEGIQVVTPYMCGFVDTLREKAAADAIFAMPMYLSNMSASVNCAVCFLRSDGLWPLFTGPMKLYIHGSDFSDEVVLQGSDYAQHAADALGPHDPPGAAYFMANDQVQVWYTASNSQVWGNVSGGTAASVRLMMPEPFTLNLITPVDLEIFGITKDGIPVRIASTYAGGIWSFNYTATYPEYMLQPKVQASVRARSIGL